jgi:hypothetical protein
VSPSTYRDLSQDTRRPRGPDIIQLAAFGHLENVAKARTSLANAIVSASIPKSPNPPIKHFNCTLWSLENKRLREVAKKDEVVADKPEDQPVANQNQLIEIPGTLSQYTEFKDGAVVVKKTEEAKARPDPAIDLVWEYIHITYKFYKEVFKRNSLDGNGIEIRASIHDGRGLDDAYWNRNIVQIVLGDAGRFDGRHWHTPTKKELDDEIILWEQIKDAKRVEAKANAAGADSATQLSLYKKRRRLELSVRGHHSLVSGWIDYDLDTIGHELTHGVVFHTAHLGKDMDWRNTGEPPGKHFE